MSWTPMYELQGDVVKKSGFGGRDQRPIKICASINTPAFGEFIAYLFYVNSVAEQFDRSQVTLIYRDDLPFKADMVRLLPTSMIVRIPGSDYLPPMDIVSPRRRIIAKGTEPWFQNGLQQQDIFITEGMATEIGLLGFERMGYLRIPEDAIAGCTEELIKRGVKPDRWFCTIHARESGYPTAARNVYRNADLDAYFAAIVHIIHELGGQVVRLGHPGMTKLLPMEGFIQLGLEDNTTFLQAFAVSRSRFLLCNPSGPLAFGEAFHVPIALANTFDWYYCNDRTIVRTVDLVAPEGTILNQMDLLDALAPTEIKAFLKKGHKINQISPEEMIKLVNQIYEASDDTQGWRVPDPPHPGPRPNQFVWPGNRIPRGRLMKMAE